MSVISASRGLCGFILVVAYIAWLPSEAMVCGSAAFDNGALYDYCPSSWNLDSYEFQERLSMEKFKKCSHSLTTCASAIFEDLLLVAEGSIVEKKKKHEDSIFREQSWFLTEPDGTPLPQDAAKDVPYNASCYVRTRMKRELKHGKFRKKIKISSSLKIRGIDPEAFDEPDFAKSSVDCDDYHVIHRATYKAKVKKMSAAVKFISFENVLTVFPFAGDFFKLDADVALPKRDAYATRRLQWTDLKLDSVKLECSVDLRFEDEEKALTGIYPYLGEISCSLDTEEVEEEGKDIHQMLEKMRSIFEKFYLTHKWT